MLCTIYLSDSVAYRSETHIMGMHENICCYDLPELMTVIHYCVIMCEPWATLLYLVHTVLFRQYYVAVLLRNLIGN